MKTLYIIFIASLTLLSGCVRYDPPPQASVPVPSNVEQWKRVPVKNWGGVHWDKRGEALGLLGNKDVVAVSLERYQKLIEVPDGGMKITPVVVPPGQGLYLVRARGYGATGGKLRFNTRTRELSVFLVAYNGEMSFPGMRWSVEDLPVVVALPAAPSRVHKSAEIGGDSCFHLMDRE
ncbi:MAG: hypothetical protein EOP88_06745 [Verrucomicrobiaceae bacterium]|nr:MAG: hypothetical protein EOP88_06745 [Verrucomicrobiaceae bacterium]